MTDATDDQDPGPHDPEARSADEPVGPFPWMPTVLVKLLLRIIDFFKRLVHRDG